MASNLIGVALAVSFLVWIDRRGKSDLLLLLLPGFCAGLTTFSAVMADTIEPKAGGFSFLIENVILSLVTVSILMPIARKLIPVRR